MKCNIGILITFVTVIGVFVLVVVVVMVVVVLFTFVKKKYISQMSNLKVVTIVIYKLDFYP